LKCIIERVLPDYLLPVGLTPILYLPDVSRQELRAGGDCPTSLQPLIELQYRGAVWHQRNAKDWTVEAFLTSEFGLGLDIAMDIRTREAILRALPLMASQPLDLFRGRRLEAEDFDRLAVADPIRDILTWMSDPDLFRQSCDLPRWDSFRNVCLRQFGFDPEDKGPATVGDVLLHDGGKWDGIWKRFREAPRLYPGLTNLLRDVSPGDLLADRSRRPSVNADLETELRRELESIALKPHSEACNGILKLEKEHRERRQWVWTELGESPLAVALEPLARLASLAHSPLGGITVESVASNYASEGWRCDEAAMDALNGAKSPADVTLVSNVVRAVYVPWLDQSARHFQELVSRAGADIRDITSRVSSQKDICIVFVDGLRFDLAGKLHAKLEAIGLRARLDHRLAPLPTVTSTAKPLASPVSELCEGSASGDEFAPVFLASKQPVTAQRLRSEMMKQGIEVLSPEELLITTSTENGGWIEIGQLDELGHSLGSRLAGQISGEVERIVECIQGLLNAGWTGVRVVTDHGWLLVPGGLKRIDLPPSLVATKWARCAAVRGESATGVPTFPWYWNSHVRIASPPGAGAFIAGNEYAHGGVSVQECVIPDLYVERGLEEVRAHITGVEWRRMRCRVTVKTNTKTLRVDLRLNWKQAATSIAASVKELDESAEASLAVADDSHEGAAATIVLMDHSGNVLDYKATTVGGDA
jgi:hypothetical protein